MLNLDNKLNYYFNTFKRISIIKIIGRIKFYNYDRFIKYKKYQKFTINDFEECKIKKINYFFHPIYFNVDIENLEFEFVNEFKKFKTHNSLKYSGSYYLWEYFFGYMEYLPATIENLIDKYNKDKAMKITISFLKNWFKNNPISSEPTWFPYTISKRLEYIIKSYVLLHDSLNYKHSLFFKYLINIHLKMIKENLETYIGYNHLLQNYKSMILANICLEKEKEIKDLLDKYIKQIIEETDNDGCYIEKTPMYQLQIIIDLLDIIIALKGISYNKKDILIKQAKKLFTFLLVIEKPNNQLPLINDTSMYYPVEWKRIKRRIEKKLVILSNQREEINICLRKNNIYHFQNSGIIIAKTKTFWILFENGSLGAQDIAGHGHADNLMILLSLRNGKEIFIDPGIGSYKRGVYRNIFRSTMMHNTISIDKKNSSEVWSDFRVGTEGIPLSTSFEKKNSMIKICGKLEWPTGEIHNRIISIDEDNNILKIKDNIESSLSENKIYTNFILNPEIKYQKLGKKVFLDENIEIKGNDYDSIKLDEVYCSKDWDKFIPTKRISFFKEKFKNGQNLEIELKLIK